MADTYDLSPADELLILSFSRAAVSEIRKRLRNVGGPASTATAVTFDSFATRLLAEVDPDGDWVDRDYDGRINAAAHEISSETEAQQIIGHYRHVIVDELQDLVAVRADLVRAILSASECGFTLFGDPAQGIYNFQAEGTERVRGAHLLFEWLKTTFPRDLDRQGAFDQLPCRNARRGSGVWAGAELNQAQPDYPRIKAGLERVVMDLDPLGDLDTLVTMLRGIPADRLPTTAVLCRYNGQALMISQALAGAGVPHRYQRSATERAVAPWVARALRGFDQGPIGRSRLMAAIEDLDDPDAPSGHEAWSLLKRLDGRRSDNLDLGRVQARLRTGDVPDELTPLLDSKIVVSTIHRAKGLEFSRVVLVDPGQLTEDDLEMPEEVRLLYVALTRSRNELWRMTSPGDLGPLVSRQPGGAMGEKGARPVASARARDSGTRFLRSGPRRRVRGFGRSGRHPGVHRQMRLTRRCGAARAGRPGRQRRRARLLPHQPP